MRVWDKSGWKKSGTTGKRSAKCLTPPGAEAGSNYRRNNRIKSATVPVVKRTLSPPGAEAGSNNRRTTLTLATVPVALLVPKQVLVKSQQFPGAFFFVPRLGHTGP